MVIRIADAEVGQLYEVKDKEQLSNELLGGRDAKFNSPASVEGFFVKTESDVSIKLEGETDIKFDCDRCAQESVKTVKFMVQANYPVDEHMEEIDISQELNESVLLSIPIQMLCSEECKGVCVGCGVNLNKERCKCKKSGEKATKSTGESPFAILKDFKTGGAKNGSTKK